MTPRHLLSLILVLGIVTPAAGDPPEAKALSSDDVTALVAALDANRFSEREAASEKLLLTGAVAIPALAQAARGESLEAADRAVWILDRLSASDDRKVQRAALESLQSADRFPAIQAEANEKLATLCETICREEFQRLGALLTIEHPITAADGVVTTVEIELGNDWKGDETTIRQLNDLQSLHQVLVRGEGVTEATLSAFKDLTLLRKLIVEGTSVRPQLVIALRQANPNLKIQVKHLSALGVRYLDTEAYAIIDVAAGTPAERADLRAGDVIAKFNGMDVTCFDLLTAHISQHKPGDEVELEIRRGDDLLQKTVRLAALEDIESAPNR